MTYFNKSAWSAVLFHQGTFIIFSSYLNSLLRENDSNVRVRACERDCYQENEEGRRGGVVDVERTVLVFTHSSGYYSHHANSCLDTGRHGVIHSPYSLCPSHCFHHAVTPSHAQQFLWWAHCTKAHPTAEKQRADAELRASIHGRAVTMQHLLTSWLFKLQS